MTDLEFAKQVYHSNAYAFVIVRDGRVVATGTRDGVGELLDAVARHGDALRGATLADRVVGKAVAMIAAFAGIAEIYTPLGSQAAAEVLAAHAISFAAERVVPLIRNKRNDGPCPLERLTMPIAEPMDAVAALHRFVSQPRQPMPAS
jgi:hypothetical protein